MTQSSLLFNPQKLHIRLLAEPSPPGLPRQRRYTLTHSDTTGDLFLTIGSDYDRRQVSSWYTRLMRDEVLGEWIFGGYEPALHIHCHVSGGLVVGTAAWRYAIFKEHLPLVLQAICQGDRDFLLNQPALQEAPVFVFFHSRSGTYNKSEAYGRVRHHLVG